MNLIYKEQQMNVKRE